MANKVPAAESGAMTDQVPSDQGGRNGRLPGDRAEPVSPRDRPVEPGRPKPEHVLFVVLGAVGTVLAFLHGLGML